MKEITRRLYTKPVMLGISFLVGVVLVVGLFVTTKSRAATTYIPAGDDEFETTNNGETYHNFAASPIPANFFGPGSQQYTGVVPLEGVPLNPAVSDTDTIIHRNQDVYAPGSTTLTMTALSLKSINPITVTYTGGGSETWNVRVNLSDFQSSTGSMSIGDGGTFDSSLSVYPKFTFTRVSDGVEKVLDTGGSGSGPAAPSSSSRRASSVDQFAVAPAPCRAVAHDDFQSQAKPTRNAATSAATASDSCAPVTLTSTNSPWEICADGNFCIPRPITEQEILASHNASPPGTKRAIAVGE